VSQVVHVQVAERGFPTCSLPSGVVHRLDASRLALVESVRADARGAMVGGKVVMLPWEGRMSNYQERAGKRVPLTGEAAWLAPGGRKPYWRGTITSADYELAE
jgi:hypothetical protein